MLPFVRFVRFPHFSYLFSWVVRLLHGVSALRIILDRVFSFRYPALITSSLDVSSHSWPLSFVPSFPPCRRPCYLHSLPQHLHHQIGGTAASTSTISFPRLPTGKQEDTSRGMEHRSAFAPTHFLPDDTKAISSPRSGCSTRFSIYFFSLTLSV
ncbi:hypothetical protein FA13DRAFT_1042667 [Coprinellus micaceus]|uniref:Uncharacterized protein n=1 Tax=Coprinellus micaceus TaxID=71717 RepID=A0A4Y7SXD6_COPMI|nr:hypothetical protein FA13DRAFT_1042667 [Coprinellus micaceus]